MTSNAPTPAAPQAASRIHLTVGPVLTYWPRDRMMQFYAEVADSPADTVVLGEVVCSRRRELRQADWLGLAADLRAAGKDVVLTGLALVESEAELRALRALADQDDWLVEAGDASALRLLSQAGRPFVIGPHINIYSRDALALHVALGGMRWVAPVELPLSQLAQINGLALAGGNGEAVQTEAWGFGRLPLAFSARCFTARHYRLRKDDCEFRCRDHADGLLLSTGEGQAFLTLNGIQTQSAGQQCLVREREALLRAGVSRLRLSPTAERFGEVLRCFDDVMNHGADARAGWRELETLALPGGLVDGFAHARPGIERMEA